MTTRMTRDERESFLAALHVGILSLNEPENGPLTVPIWYGYEPGGDVWFVTGSESRKGRLLREGTRASLCVQTEDAPYKYVTVEGPVVSIRAADIETDTRPLAHRYLGEERGDRYIASTSDDRDGSIRVALRPEHWLTVDYGKAR